MQLDRAFMAALLKKGKRRGRPGNGRRYGTISNGEGRTAGEEANELLPPDPARYLEVRPSTAVARPCGHVKA